MKKGKKVICMALVASMALASLTACGSKNNTGKATDKPQPTSIVVNKDVLSTVKVPAPEKVEKTADAKSVKLTVWCPAEEIDLMKTLCETFNTTVYSKEYNVTFDIKPISESDVGNQIKNDPAKSADVFMFAGDQLASLADQKLLFSIDALADEVKKLDNVDITNFYDSRAYESGKYDGKLYGLSFTANQYFLYYNKSMLNETDVKTMEGIMAKDIKGAQNFSINLDNGWYICSFFAAADCLLFGKDGTVNTECNWNDAKGVQVVKYLKDMADKKKNKFHNNSGTDDAKGLMQDKKLASWAIGSWKSNDVKAALGDDYAATCLPTIKLADGTEGSIKPFADYKFLGVNVNTKETKLSALLAYFLSGDYAQSCRLAIRAYAPTVKSLQDAVLKDTSVDPAVVAATLQMKEENSVLRPSASNLSTYWDFGAALGSYVVNDKEGVKDDAAIQKTLDTIVKAITVAK